MKEEEKITKHRREKQINEVLKMTWITGRERREQRGNANG